MGKIEVQLRVGAKTVKCAWQRGTWAVTQHATEPEYWTVTHVPTGYGLPRCLSRAEAYFVAGAAYATAPKWGARLKPRQAATRAQAKQLLPAMKAALVAIGRWDA